MFVKFNHPWGKYLPGDFANIELTLSRRLVGTGIAEYRTDKNIKTTPEIANEESEPKKETEAKKEPKEEPEKEVEKPVEEKKPPKRKYTKPEKAVKIEK